MVSSILYDNIFYKWLDNWVVIMTEKRFRHNGSMIFDDRKALNTIDVVELLNNLHEENEQLKKELNDTKHQLDNIFKYRRQMEGIE